jgi:hypothetical protein
MVEGIEPRSRAIGCSEIVRMVAGNVVEKIPIRQATSSHRARRASPAAPSVAAESP